MNVDTVSKQRRLVEQLAEKTKSEKIEWSEGDYSDGVKASFGRHTVDIFERTPDFGENDYVVVISDDWKGEIDRFSDVDLSIDAAKPSVGGTYYQLLDAMFKSAQRQIKGVDKALDSILNELDSILPF